MKKTSGILVFFILIICQITGCKNSPPAQYHHTIFIFGTLLEITISDTTPELANRAFDQLEKDYQLYHAAWTPWQKSALTEINSAIKQNKKLIPSPDILPLIKQSISLASQSLNTFNPAIGNLIKLWQFHRHDEPGITPPDNEAILNLLKDNPVMSDLIFEGVYLASKNTAVQLNFGAFAKGYAIDRSFEKLQQLGIDNAIINAGGDLRVSGTQGSRLWNIGIRHPRNHSVIASIEVHDGESVFTSGDYERYYTHNNKRFHHIIDPKTGYPTQGLTSVTVIHPNAAVADAAATALMVAGPSDWYRIAKNMGVRYVMLIEENETIIMNPAMAERVQFKDTSNPGIVLSQPL